MVESTNTKSMIVGLSTDIKPTINVPDGTNLLEVDTTNAYVFFGGNWYPLGGGSGGGGGATVLNGLSDVNITTPQNGQIFTYNGTKWVNANPITKERSSTIMCIAHRGWYDSNVYANTATSLKKAAEKGFEWVEIDIRKTLDGYYVLGHDATMTMYGGGTSHSVTFATANYTDIMNYTFDSQGNYGLCTLQEAFSICKHLDLKIILDLKAGDKCEIWNLANDMGMIMNCMVSVTPNASTGEKGFINAHPGLKVRCDITYSYSNIKALIENLPNSTVYADCNIRSGRTAHIQKALALHMPIICSQPDDADSIKAYLNVACGLMTEGAENITADQMVARFDTNKSMHALITTSEDSVATTVGTEISLTATSSTSDAGGYINAYTEKPTIASCSQTTWGTSVTIKVKGVSAGTTKLKIFNAGTFKELTVTVS